MLAAIEPGDLIGPMRVRLLTCAGDRASSAQCALSPLPQASRQSNAFDARY